MKLPENEKIILFLLMDVIEGLEYLHSKQIVHRDVKPENILIKFINESECYAVIGDYGLCREIDRCQSPLGTLNYAAPELLSRQAYDYRVD